MNIWPPSKQPFFFRKRRSRDFRRIKERTSDTTFMVLLAPMLMVCLTCLLLYIYVNVDLWRYNGNYVCIKSLWFKISIWAVYEHCAVYASRLLYIHKKREGWKIPKRSLRGDFYLEHRIDGSVKEDRFSFPFVSIMGKPLPKAKSNTMEKRKKNSHSKLKWSVTRRMK